MPKVSQKDREEAIERLRELLQPGDTVYTILRHRSRSGMSRSISAIVVNKPDWSKGTIEAMKAGACNLNDVSWVVARALGWRIDNDHGGVKIGGAGMDMGFHLVYSLSCTLWPDGVPCTGRGCLSNDHVNGEHDYTPHSDKHPHLHRDGGYALRHRWL